MGIPTNPPNSLGRNVKEISVPLILIRLCRFGRNVTFKERAKYIHINDWQASFFLSLIGAQTHYAAMALESKLPAMHMSVYA
jgi:hypothetical protein